MLTPEHKQLRADYLAENPQCQYTVACGMDVSFYGHISKKLCVEHIWNRKGPMSEHWSNYATVCPAAHDWKHANSVPARIAIMHFKAKLAMLTGNVDHFDTMALSDAAGQDVLEWVRRKLPECPKWAARKGEDLLSMFEDDYASE